MRIGIGYDIHPIEQGGRLILGGVEVPAEFGLIGHSDADVLLHAVADALLGAAAMGDLGTHFSDRDERYHGIASSKLLGEVMTLLTNAGHRVQNIDSIIMAERPLLAPYVPAMRERIAELLQVSLSCANVKAKRGEGLGSIGTGEAISAWAAVTIA